MNTPKTFNPSATSRWQCQIVPPPMTLLQAVGIVAKLIKSENTKPVAAKKFADLLLALVETPVADMEKRAEVLYGDNDAWFAAICLSINRAFQDMPEADRLTALQELENNIGP